MLKTSPTVQKDNRMDLTYRIVGGQLELYPLTPKAAGWISRYLTTNVAQVIYYEKQRGGEVLAFMREDGLQVAEDTSRT